MKAKLALLLALVMTLSLSAPTGAAPSPSSATTVAGHDSDNRGDDAEGGTGPTQLDYPVATALDDSGHLYVADLDNGRIQKVTLDGSINPTTLAASVVQPGGLALTPEGDLYIADRGTHLVTRVSFDNGGNATTTVVAGTNGHGTGTDQLRQPSQIALDSAGNLYIADFENHRVQRVAFDALGNPVRTVTVAGGTGQGPGPDQLSFPSGVTIDNDGNLYVSDTDNHRVQRITFDSNGNRTGTLTVGGGNGPGAGANELQTPVGLTFDSNGNLYIADHINNRIQKITFDNNGNPTQTTTIAGINGFGTDADQLGHPSGVTIDNNGNLYIADSLNNRVQRIALDIVNPSITDAASITTKVGTAKTVNYTCADTGGSELATCTATLNGQPVNNGHLLNTTKRGTQTLLITATDNAGNNTTQTHTITIQGKRELTGIYKNASGTNASVARLYMATFKRAPEGKGFDFWVTAHSNGKTLQAMADFFVTDQEFRTLYGNTSNAQFVDLMYQNVMGRTPGTKAKAFWLKDLNTGHRTRAQMLLWFAESTEFKTLTHTS